jgi:hypothetical protein
MTCLRMTFSGGLTLAGTPAPMTLFRSGATEMSRWISAPRRRCGSTRIADLPTGLAFTKVSRETAVTAAKLFRCM